MPDSWTYSPNPAVEAAVARIQKKHEQLRPAGLARPLRLLAKLGDPHLSLPPVFHVAGTNGKGSALAFLQAALEAAGLSVHKFTSPHLVRFEERIVLNGRMIDSARLLPLLAECAAAAEGTDVSFFEFFTALFFLAAARARADAVLLETGMGGLYDSTNVVPATTAILTRISFDHMRLLGDTLPAIALQKAGIMRAGGPCIVAPQPDGAVMDVFESEARRTGARLAAHGAAWRVRAEDGGMSYSSAALNLRLPLPALAGAHQAVNAGTAIAALAHSPLAACGTRETWARALENAAWPGRLQRLDLPFLPQGWELWLDGAHNDSGAEALALQAQAWGGDKPLHLVTAMKKNKVQDSGAPGDFYGALRPYARSVHVLDAPFTAPMTEARALCDYLAGAGYENPAVAENLESIVASLAFQHARPGRILVTGSLYLVGHVLKRHSTYWKDHETAHRACG